MILYLSGKLEKNESINMVARLSEASMIGDAFFTVYPNKKFLDIEYKEFYKAMKEKGLINIKWAL